MSRRTIQRFATVVALAIVAAGSTARAQEAQEVQLPVVPIAVPVVPRIAVTVRPPVPRRYRYSHMRGFAIGAFVPATIFMILESVSDASDGVPIASAIEFVPGLGSIGAAAVYASSCSTFCDTTFHWIMSAVIAVARMGGAAFTTLALVRNPHAEQPAMMWFVVPLPAGVGAAIAF